MAVSGDEPGGPLTNSGANEDRNQSSRGRRYWLLPIIIATLSVTSLLLLNPAWGADVAAIIVIPINVAAALVPILANYNTRKAPVRTRRMTKKLRIAIVFTVAALVFSGGAYWVVREPDPMDYLSGTVYVGINEENYPGWNAPEDNKRTGFDIALAEWLARRYDFKIEYVPLTREGRIDRLAEADDNLELVIANLSINEEREKKIDLVGPYFLDTQGLYTYREGDTLESIEPGQVCVPDGTTAGAQLERAGWDPVSEPSFARCFGKLRVDDTTWAVSTDTAVMKPYIYENRDELSNVNVIENINPERYGIGIPDNRPRLCAELSGAIKEFLKEEWDEAFVNHLGKRGVDAKNRKPDPDSLRECDSTALFG